MPTMNINVEVSSESANVNSAKVDMLCDYFFMLCDAFKANLLEVSTAIGIMQDALFEDFGCLPITTRVMEGVLEISKEGEKKEGEE